MKKNTSLIDKVGIFSASAGVGAFLNYYLINHSGLQYWPEQAHTISAGILGIGFGAVGLGIYSDIKNGIKGKIK